MTAARASQQRAAANPCYFAQVGRSQRCEYVGRWPQLFLKAHCIDPWRQRGKMKAPEHNTPIRQWRAQKQHSSLQPPQAQRGEISFHFICSSNAAFNLVPQPRPLLVNIDRFGGGQIKVQRQDSAFGGKNGCRCYYFCICTRRAAREKEVTQENAERCTLVGRRRRRADGRKRRRRRRIGKVMGSRDLDLSPAPAPIQ
jgi:hypothetical protein